MLWKQIKQGKGIVKEEDTIGGELKEAHPGEVTPGQRTEGREWAMQVNGGRAFQADKWAGAKALRKERIRVV